VNAIYREPLSAVKLHYSNFSGSAQKIINNIYLFDLIKKYTDLGTALLRSRLFLKLNFFQEFRIDPKLSTSYEQLGFLQKPFESFFFLKILK